MAAPRRLILFRFHRDAPVCRSRIRWLRGQNPEVPVYGLFGGTDEGVASTVGAELDGLFAAKERTSKWLWLHGDLFMRQWFLEVGHRQDFDVLHLLEWDLLLAGSLEERFRHVPPDAVGLTALEPISKVAASWSAFRFPGNVRYQRFRDLLRTELGFAGPELGCQGPGPVFPRRFLEAYARHGPSELVHEELRLPAVAQALGFRLVDTRLSPGWPEPDPLDCFNCEGREVALASVREQLSRAAGRRAFHPFRLSFDEGVGPTGQGQASATR